jgi:hypothetical protein
MKPFDPASSSRESPLPESLLSRLTGLPRLFTPPDLAERPAVGGRRHPGAEQANRHGGARAALGVENQRARHPPRSGSLLEGTLRQNQWSALAVRKAGAAAPHCRPAVWPRQSHHFVLQVVALGFQDIEALVLDRPSGPATGGDVTFAGPGLRVPARHLSGHESFSENVITGLAMTGGVGPERFEVLTENDSATEVAGQETYPATMPHATHVGLDHWMPESIRPIPFERYATRRVIIRLPVEE